jgi:hypothetical protein
MLSAKTFKFGIFDTAHLEGYRYDPFIQICKSIGFDVDYKSIAKIMDSDDLEMQNYDAILFVLDIEFLKGMTTSFVSHKILRLIEKYARKPDKLVGLAFPPIGAQIPNKALLFAPIFRRAGLHVNPHSFEILDVPDDFDIQSFDREKVNKNLEGFFDVTKRFFNVPMEARGFLYHTTLSLPRRINFVSYASMHDSYFSVLPIKNTLPFRLSPTLPYGIYSFNPIRRNHLFLTSSTLLSFSGVGESFHVCPANFSLRQKMHELMQEMMWELKMILAQKNKDEIDFARIRKDIKPNLPKTLALLGKNSPKKKKTKRKIAWMEILPFERDGEKDRKEQRLLVDCILKSGSDLDLWITLNPHSYYSPIAKHADKTEKFYSALSKFTKKLSQKAKELKVQLPKILVGYEITNNIYEPNLPKRCAVDLYLNKYVDVPDPLDKSFWQNEIKDPLVSFLYEWEKPQINNGIKLAGVVLDLEMYCRRTTGSFLGTMGFDVANFEKFKKLNSLEVSTKNTEVFAKVLVKKKLLQKYFEFLQDQAEDLGKELKSFFHDQIKDGLIYCYAPNISIDWFYKGFYKGLGESTRPVQLLTFNAEFDSHRPWLQKNGINANHSSVLMLSKLRSEKDFARVDDILKNHDGIWLNRFSRFAEDNHNSWMSIEQSPMNEKDKEKFFDFLKKK